MQLNRTVIKTILVFIVMLSATMIYAQPGGGGGQGLGGAPSGAGAPIDGGACMLLASIAGYAYRRLKNY